MAIRLAVVAFGFAALVWSGLYGVRMSGYSPLGDLATKIIRGENVDISDIEARLPLIDKLERSRSCWPKALHDAAVVRGRLVQVALDSSEPKQFDAAHAKAIAAVRRSLVCAPSDAFLWFALFWLQNLQEGLQPNAVDDLRESYMLGPYEGWIELKRSKYALAAYSLLPADVRKRTRLGFAAMVNAGFIFEAADLLAGPGWPIRQELLAALGTVKERNRWQLAMSLRRLGLEVDVPGIQLPDWRPWQVN